MKKPLLLVLFLLMVAVLIPDDAEAQRRRRGNRYKRKRNKNVTRYKGNRRIQGRFRPYNFVSLGLNASNYFGDLAPLNRNASADISFTRPGIGVSFGRRFNSHASARANLNYVRLIASDFSANIDGDIASDATRHARNLSFRNDVIELSAIFDIDLIGNQGSSAARVAFTPFVFGGIGFLYHNPQGRVPFFDFHDPNINLTDPGASPASVQRFENAGDWVSLRQFGTEGQNIAGNGVEPYSNFQLALPIGIGFKLRLPENFDAAIEFGYRILFFDYLDDASGRFIDLNEFEDPLARAFADRSLENIDIISEQPRDINRINSISRVVAVRDANGALVYRTRSEFVEGGIRGTNKNDSYFVTQIKLIYNIGGVKKRAKFR